MAEAVAGELVVADFDHQHRRHGDEGQVLVAAPTAGFAGPAGVFSEPGRRGLGRGAAAGRHDVRGGSPGRLEVVQSAKQVFGFPLRERRTVADEVEFSPGVVEAEQDRAHTSAVLLHPVAAYDAVDRPPVLELDHLAPSLGIGPLERLCDHSVEPCRFEVMEPTEGEADVGGTGGEEPGGGQVEVAGVEAAGCEDPQRRSQFLEGLAALPEGKRAQVPPPVGQ